MGGRGTLPVKLTRPALASVHGAPKIDAANEHVIRISGIHLKAQIPEGLTQVVRAVHSHTEEVGTRGFGGHHLPRSPCICTSPKAQEVLLQVVAGHRIQRVTRCRAVPRFSCELNAPHAFQVGRQIRKCPRSSAVHAVGQPLAFQGEHHSGVGHPHNVPHRGTKALQHKRPPTVLCGEQPQISPHPKVSVFGGVGTKDMKALLVLRRKPKRQRRPSCSTVPRFQNANAVGVAAVAVPRGQPNMVQVVGVNPCVACAQRGKCIDAKHRPRLSCIQRLPQTA